jgi:hypothetical protein
MHKVSKIVFTSFACFIATGCAFDAGVQQRQEQKAINKKFSKEYYDSESKKEPVATLMFDSNYSGVTRFYINDKQASDTCNGLFERVDGEIRKKIPFFKDVAIEPVKLSADQPIALATNIATDGSCDPPAQSFTPVAGARYIAKMVFADSTNSRAGSCGLLVMQILPDNTNIAVATKVLPNCLITQ